ncbi:MAG: hypothetical protein M1837_006287 [Sclerophora amabilis]|nr:MAG: hypothetical protein M1837_006287 [Sclerophora amabilis]
MSGPAWEEPQAPIEAEPDTSSADSDSALGDDVSNYTASLSSSILNFPYENGRRYHAYKDGAYVMPNDENENERLDLTHGKLRLCLENKLYLAPIGSSPQRILDIGTGTGIWAIEMGDDFPMAEIIGTDLSPIQPNLVPPNVKFEVDDCEEPWTFQEKFDYIHARYLAAAIVDWPKLMGQIYKQTTPGGWVEFQDYDLQYYSDDGSLRPEQPVLGWINSLIKCITDFGKEPSPGPKLKGWVEDAGFKNVEQRKFRLPIGPWPKDKHLKTLGSWTLVAAEDGLEAFTLRLYTNVLGWKPEEVQVLLANVRKDLRNPKIHAYLNFYVVYGQKPEDAED